MPRDDREAPRRWEDRDERATGARRDRDEDRAPRIPDPELPDDVTPKDLHGQQNELKTLSKENADRVARHIVMAARLIDDDPQLAHEHALAAVRHAGRVALARETLAVTAYTLGDFALALRELRTLRRITGRNDHVAMIVDSERGVGRPEKALEEGRAADRDVLSVEQRVELAIALSGARLDLGQTELALAELDVPEADPDRAFRWSPGLFAARAAVLEDLGRDDEAAEWHARAEIAADAIDQDLAQGDEILVDEVEEIEPEFDHEAEHTDADEQWDADEHADADEPAGPDAADAEPADLDSDAEPSEDESSEEPLADEHDDEAEHDGKGEPADESFTIEDEVDQILAEAGVIDAGENPHTNPQTEDEEADGTDGAVR
ncbi:hypothetical protein ACWDR7_11335 [Microbacterium sp. NPDC003461]